MKYIKAYIQKMPVPERVLLIIMALTVLFFFFQSSLPPAISSAESDSVSGFLELLIPSDTVIGKFIHENLRKIGHFAEYGVFGAEMAVFIWFFTKRNAINAFRAAVLTLFIALCDETVQIFSGRGPAITDVWLDFSGFITLGILTFCALYTAHILKRKHN